MQKSKKQLRYRFLLFWVLLILCITGCSDPKQTRSEIAAETGALTIHFLDVGEGNAALIESDGKYMLVDGGVNSKSSYVVAYLKKQGIESFEYVIATHYDADHLAGIVGVLHVFPVKTVIGPEYDTDTKIYDSFMKQIEEQNYTLNHPNAGDNYQLGNASFTILGPVRYRHTDVNEDSIIIRIECGETSFLIAGDAGKESELEIVESGVPLKADVYLVNHHGSETSTTQEFLDMVDPAYAVISSGTEGNNYGHPRKAVLDRLLQKNIELFRTDIQGEIIVASDGKNLSFSQSPCNDFTPGGDELKKETAQPLAEEYTYILNTNSYKFHLPDCQAAAKMKGRNKSYFTGTKEEAIANGYDPCGWCLP